MLMNALPYRNVDVRHGRNVLTLTSIGMTVVVSIGMTVVVSVYGKICHLYI